MQRITRLPVQRRDTSNVHRIAGLTARYFTQSIYRGKLIGAVREEGEKKEKEK